MPIGPSHRQVSPRAPFVGRKEELDLVESLLREPQPPDQYRVLSFSGVGGQGKSRLLDEIQERLRGEDFARIPFGRIDFDQEGLREPDQALLHLRHQLAETGVRTNAFDWAFHRLFALSYPGRDLRSEHPGLFRFGSDSFLGEVFELAGGAAWGIPGGKLLFTHLSNLTTRLKRWYETRGNALLEEIDRRSRQELLDYLPVCLGADLCAHCDHFPDRRPVVLCDTYEKLWESRHLVDPGGSQWMRSFVEESPGCLFVVVGRRAVNWDEIDADWKPFLIRRSLDALSDGEQDHLFEAAGIDDPSLCERFRRTARGHPFSLSAQFNIHRKILAAGGKPRPEDFPETRQEILARLLEHLGPSLREIVEVLAVPDLVHPLLWAHLGRSGFPAFDAHGLADIDFDVTFRKDDEGYLVMHDLMREHLLADLVRRKPEFLQRVHRAVFEFFDGAAGLDRKVREELGFSGEKFLPMAQRDEFLLQAEKHLLRFAPSRHLDWCLGLFARSEPEEGRAIQEIMMMSKVRGQLLARARSRIGTLDGDTAVAALRLAHLDLMGNPFSRSSQDLLVETVGHLEGSPNPGELGELVADACSALLHVGADFPFEKLEHALQVLGHRDPVLELRIANFRKDGERQRTLVARILEEAAEDDLPGVNAHLAIAIAESGSGDLLSRWLELCERDDPEDRMRAGWTTFLSGLLADLGKAELALEAAEVLYPERDWSGKAGEIERCLGREAANRIRLELVECLVNVDRRNEAIRLAGDLVTEDWLVGIRGCVSQWRSSARERRDPWEMIEQWEKDSDTEGLSERMLEACARLAEDGENSAAESFLGMARETLEGIRKIPPRPVGASDQFVAGDRIYETRSSSRLRHHRLRVEIVVGDGGTMMIMVNLPEFRSRAGDFCLLAGRNPMRMFFRDHLDGWFTFGISIDPALEAYLGEGGRALLVWMDIETRKPVTAVYIPVYVVNE